MAVIAAALCLLAAHAPAQAASPERDAKSIKPDATQAYAQAEPKRARTRIRVTPRCLYRTRALDYPAPYECESPGPGYMRQCESWLAQEARPSGTVIVPHMRCWWQPG